MEENGISKKLSYMNLEATRLRGRPRSRWQDEVREDERLVGGKSVEAKGIWQTGMKEAPENGKESLHSAHASGINEWKCSVCLIL